MYWVYVMLKLYTQGNHLTEIHGFTTSTWAKPWRTYWMGVNQNGEISEGQRPSVFHFFFRPKKLDRRTMMISLESVSWSHICHRRASFSISVPTWKEMQACWKGCLIEFALFHPCHPSIQSHLVFDCQLNIRHFAVRRDIFINNCITRGCMFDQCKQNTLGI